MAPAPAESEPRRGAMRWRLVHDHHRDPGEVGTLDLLQHAVFPGRHRKGIDHDAHAQGGRGPRGRSGLSGDIGQHRVAQAVPIAERGRQMKMATSGAARMAAAMKPSVE